MDEEKINSLKKTLSEKEYVDVTYLYGSQVTGRQHKESDVDVGLVLGKEKDLGELSRLERELSSELSEEVDLTVLNGADPRLVYKVLKEGETVFSRDEERRIRFEDRALKKFIEMKPFIEEYDRKVKERLTA